MQKVLSADERRIPLEIFEIQTISLPLLEALQEKFCDALLPLAATNLRRRDAVLPAVPRKTHVVIGMRRAERTCFLKQLLAEWRLICGDDALQDPRG